jgi:nickel-dependent lactate racemase
MHRPSTGEEKVNKLGADVVSRYRVIDSQPRNADELVELGTTSTGAPIVVNRTAYEADLLIATGIVEPHQYAGYSGGRKTVAIGAAGEPVIQYTHAPRMLDLPGTRLGRVDDNRFHQTVTEVAQAAGLRFILNVICNDRGEVVAVRAGDPERAFEALVAEAAKLYVRPISHAYDIVVGGVGYPKDANLYQASRGATYLYFAPKPVVRPGGVLIIPARIQEGAGEGVGEQRCHEALRDASDPATLVDEMRRRPFQAGEQRAYMIAQTLTGCDVIIVGAEHPDIVREMKMIPAADMDEALRFAAERVTSQAEVLVVPHALLTLPMIEDN